MPKYREPKGVQYDNDPTPENPSGRDEFSNTSQMIAANLNAFLEEKEKAAIADSKAIGGGISETF